MSVTGLELTAEGRALSELHSLLDDLSTRDGLTAEFREAFASLQRSFKADVIEGKDALNYPITVKEIAILNERGQVIRSIDVTPEVFTGQGTYTVQDAVFLLP